MRKIISCASLICLAFVSRLNAQQPNWDSTYRPDIYASRLDMFKSFKHSKKDIVFLGNSITFWAEWGELLQSKRVRNRGIPGDLTFGVLARLDEVIGGKPSKVFILIGINDIAKGVPDSIILANYERIIQRIKTGSPLTKIFFQTMLPTNSSFNKLTTHYNKDEHIKNVNEGLKKIAALTNIELIDLYAAFVDNEGNMPKNLTFDGVHLTKDGYFKWAKMIMGFIN